jgi:hypothetical protein
MVSLLSARAAFAQTAPPTEESIHEVIDQVYEYVRKAAPHILIKQEFVAAPVVIELKAVK